LFAAAFAFATLGGICRVRSSAVLIHPLASADLLRQVLAQ